MGWARGSEIFTEMIDVISTLGIDEARREELYSSLITIFEDHDCDTLDECVGIDDAFDAAWEDLHPPEEPLIDEIDIDDWDDQSGGSF